MTELNKRVVLNVSNHGNYQTDLGNACLAPKWSLLSIYEDIRPIDSNPVEVFINASCREILIFSSTVRYHSSFCRPTRQGGIPPA